MQASCAVEGLAWSPKNSSVATHCKNQTEEKMGKTENECIQDSSTGNVLHTALRGEDIISKKTGQATRLSQVFSPTTPEASSDR